MNATFDETPRIKWFITEDGKIFSIKKDGTRYDKKSTVHCRGYVYVRTVNGNYQVHRLVASAFIPNPENKPCVNHKDGDKTNNKVSNLEWVTYKENTQHALRTGLSRLPQKNEGKLKYSNEDCREVLNMVKGGMGYKQAGEKYSMPYSTVAHLVRGSRRLIK